MTIIHGVPLNMTMIQGVPINITMIQGVPVNMTMIHLFKYLSIYLSFFTYT